MVGLRQSQAINSLDHPWTRADVYGLNPVLTHLPWPTCGRCLIDPPLVTAMGFDWAAS